MAKARVVADRHTCKDVDAARWCLGARKGVGIGPAPCGPSALGPEDEGAGPAAAAGLLEGVKDLALTLSVKTRALGLSFELGG